MLKFLLSLPSDLDDMCDKAVFKHISKVSSVKKLLERYTTALTHAGKHLAFVLPSVSINTQRVMCNYQTKPKLPPRMLQILSLSPNKVLHLCAKITSPTCT